MTLQELYQEIGGSYEQATRVLRVDRLIDKHIRKFATNGVIDRLVEVGGTGDAQELFDAAHAAKGVCGNLGLTGLADATSRVAEEFRPGNARTLSDAEVAALISQISEQYRSTAEGIARYIAG